MHVGDQHGVGWGYQHIHIPNNRRAGNPLRRSVRVNNRCNDKTAIKRTNGSDLRKVGGADERDPGVATLARRLKSGHAVGLRPPEQGERIRHEFQGEPRLLGEAARRQIVGIAPCRRLTNLDQPFLDATPEIGVGKPKRNAKFRCEPALGLLAAAPDIFQQPQHDPGLLDIAGL